MSLHSFYNTIYPFVVTTARRKAKSLIKKYRYFTETDSDDLEQEFAIIVLKKLGKYDSNKSSIKTFISRVINNRAADLIESRKLNYNTELQSNIDLELIIDNVSEIDDLFRETSSIDIIDQMELAFDIKQLSNKLPKDLVILSEMLKTMSISEIAKVTKKSRTTIYKKIEKLKAMTIEHDFEDYF